MRTWMLRSCCCLIVSAAALITFSWTRGQDGGAADTSRPSAVPRTAAKQEAPARDLSKLSPLQQQMYLSAQRGADWLCRVHGADGRFAHGYVPALRTALEGDHFLRQAGAGAALARAARFTGNEQYAARARQAVLTLLAETEVDPKWPGVRTTTLPPVLVNRLAAAGCLVLAIHELPAPADDLLQQSDELCAYVRGQQRPDGSLSDTEKPGETAPGDYSGLALYGLMRSQQHRPAAWKSDVARKALAYYLPRWRANKDIALVPWQTAAYAEAYLATGEQTFADAVYEMADWLGDLQYPALDPAHPLWGGGFMGWADDKSVAAAPTIRSATYAEALAEAGRVARKAGDLTRYPRYKESLERCLQFLARLQYTDANTQHFADWYRPSLVGAFYASHQDGNVRLDYTQHAVCAMLQYLAYVVD